MSEQSTEDIGRLPMLPWCRDCWDQIGEADGELPDQCPECGSTEVTML